MTTLIFESPLGFVRVTGNDAGVSTIVCVGVSENEPVPATIPEPVSRAVQQLTEYFAGTRKTFDFLINPAGTTFQQTVWNALLDVPFGTTLSYLTLTRRISDKKAVRAVAAANGRNPLWIVVPCHRIVGTDGSLTGYAGGLWRKQWLLAHERSTIGQLSLF